MSKRSDISATRPPLHATRLLDQLCERLRYLHDSPRTEQSYVHWVKAFVRWSGMRIAFINDASAVRRILDHLGEPTRPPRVAPARGPPLWEAATAASNDLAWDHTFPPAPAIEFDQRITWCGATPPSRWVRVGGRCSEREIPGSGHGPVRLLRAGTRQDTESVADWTAKTDIDHDQAVKDTRAWAIELPILFCCERLE